MLDGIDDFSLPMHLQSKYQTYYNHTLYGAWISSLPMPDVGTRFSFSDNIFMNAKLRIAVATLGLFILSHVLVPPKQLVALIPFFDHICCRSDYLNVVKYKYIISMYSMCMNGYVYGNFNKKNLLYIDGHSRTHGNIVGFINSSRCPLYSVNLSFEECWLFSLL